MRKYLIYTILILFSSNSFAQGLTNNGAKIVVGTGSYLRIDGLNGNYRNETNVTPASIDLAGTFTVTGNVTNNVANADILGIASTGNLVLNGTLPQTLGGTTTVPFLFPNLTINNATGVLLSHNAQINGNMTFTSGLVDIGNTNFTFGGSAAIAGTPSTTSMLITTGTGQVQKIWSGIGAFTYPIGDNNGKAKYSPVSLNFTAGTYAVGAVTGVNVVNTRYNDPLIAGSYLNRYWNISQTGITAFTCDATLQYTTADVSGTESSINGWRVLPTPITPFHAVNTTLHQLTATGLTSFGTFTGVSNNTQFTLKVFLQGLYNATNSNMNKCQDFVNTVPVNKFAGTIVDTITVELHDPVTYSTVVYRAAGIELNQNGTCNSTGFAYINIPGCYSGSYYITIKTRNHLETISAIPVSFAASTIDYNFSDVVSKAYTNNQTLVNTNVYAVYAGDINQSGSVNLNNVSIVNSAALQQSNGYLPADVNGDGIVDLLDVSLANSNALLQIVKLTP